LNFDNGHRSRQGQHSNKNRGRGRNNRRPSGGGGQSSSGGGNSVNRVYESNGPDVKVRGTAQTIAEKYMQLGRDAQSSGDNVMAESYFQFSEHYFRVMAAAQPVGQPTQQLRRPEDEDFEDDGEEGTEGEAEGAQPILVQEGVSAESAEPGNDASRPAEMDRSEQRNFRQRDNRDKFRPRWQNKRDQQNGDREPRAVDPEGQAFRDEPQRDFVSEQQSEEAAPVQWEAPSFLQRPAPVVDVDTAEAPVAEKRARTPRRPRVVAADVPPLDETPQGE
jgi:hypothetical protein